MVQAIKRDEVFIEPEGIHVETHQPERRSRKPPLLLVHGALTGSWLWTEVAAYLAERSIDHTLVDEGNGTHVIVDGGQAVAAASLIPHDFRVADTPGATPRTRTGYLAAAR